MPTGTRTPPLLAFALLLAVCISAPASAQDLATVGMTGGSIHWTPQGRAAGMVLTVAGAGHDVRQEFGPGEAPTFTMIDAKGSPLPDGAYTWELREVAAKRERGAAEVGGSLAVSAHEARKQSGSFTIAGGSIVDPNEVEVDAGPYNR